MLYAVTRMHDIFVSGKGTSGAPLPVFLDWALTEGRMIEGRRSPCQGQLRERMGDEPGVCLPMVGILVLDER